VPDGGAEDDRERRSADDRQVLEVAVGRVGGGRRRGDRVGDDVRGEAAGERDRERDEPRGATAVHARMVTNLA
jgi:hypothetical protein